MMLYTSKQGPSNALNIVIYRNQLQDVQWQARWFIYWCPAKLRSFGSLSMLSDSDRIINIAPYSVNEFLFYFILFNWGWMVAVCLQNLPWTVDLCWIICCLVSKEHPIEKILMGWSGHLEGSWTSVFPHSQRLFPIQTLPLTKNWLET